MIPVSIERWVTPIPGDTVTIGGLVDRPPPAALKRLSNLWPPFLHLWSMVIIGRLS
jgi:hypothetical protein